MSRKKQQLVKNKGRREFVANPNNNKQTNKKKINGGVAAAQ